MRASCGVYAWLRGGRWTLSWPSRGDVSVFAAYLRESLVIAFPRIGSSCAIRTEPGGSGALLRTRGTAWAGPPEL